MIQVHEGWSISKRGKTGLEIFEKACMFVGNCLQSIGK